MTQTLAPTTHTKLSQLLIPSDADKSIRSRLGLFVQCQAASGKPWYDVDLVAYRDNLIARGFAPATISAHLSAVRSRYRALLTDNSLRSQWLNSIGAELVRLGQPDDPANRRAMLDEYHTRIKNAIDPTVASVKHKKVQDRADSAHVRLTQSQAEAMLYSPGVDTLPALRDTVVIALLLCTGLREAELCALEVRDLRQSLGGKLAVHVREGKGMKERLVPYGDLAWVLTLVDHWLARAGIKSGRVLRSFWKGSEKVRGFLSVRSVENIVTRYPVTDETTGKLITPRPHDLRRTYAKRQYDAGMDLVAISQNLGHSDTRTTLLYIGDLSADQRSSKQVYRFDLSRLK